MGRAGKRHVDGVYRITLQSVELPRRPQASRRTERVRRCACAGVTCAHATPLRLKQGNQRSTKVLVLGVRSRQLGQAPRVTRVQKLSTAREGIHKAPCAWRTPPPQPGQVPILPVCKSYQRRKKRPAVYPPPIRGRPRYYPYAKVISSAQSDLRSQMVQASG